VELVEVVLATKILETAPIATIDIKCPYFTIFLEPSDEVGQTYDGFIRGGAKLLKKKACTKFINLDQ
jgi:hypothetical protein